MIIVKIFFSLVALISSTITACHMVSIHGAKAALEDMAILNNSQKKMRLQKEVCHDYIFNFFGTLLGWVAAYYFIFSHPNNKAVDIPDLVIIFVAYIGITGYLPHLIINKGFKP